MAELGMFFDAMNTGTELEPVWDRTYLAERFAAYFAQFLSNGVFANNPDDLTVEPSTGFNVFLTKGFAYILGYTYENTSLLSHTIEAPGGVNDRIDRIVVRLDKPARRIYSAVLKGTSSLGTPTPPQLTRSVDIFEISLCQIYISRTSTGITAADITSEKFDTSVCGIVHALVDHINTDEIYNQIQADLELYRTQYQADWSAWTEANENSFDVWFETIQDIFDEIYNQYQAEIAAHESNALAVYDAFVARMGDYETTAQADFEAWVATLKDILDEEVAGHLQLEIEELQTRFPTDVLGTVSTEPTTQRLYPTCALFSTTWAAGIGGAGNGPAGGGSVVAIETDQSFAEYDLTVTAPAAYKNYTNINPVSNTMYAFMAADAADTQSLVLKIAKEA